MNRLNVTNQIVQYCKDHIILGNWKVGERIPSEKELTDTLGVSRANVRTAIQQLVGIGVLHTVHGKGTYLLTDNFDDVLKSEVAVSPEDCRDLVKVLEFRRIVEPEACYMAAVNMPPGFLERLENLWEAMQKEHADKREGRFVTADLAFHKEIGRASGNPLLAKIMNQVFDEYRKNHDQIHQMHGFGDGIYYHGLILEAIRDGQPEKAKQLMYEHIQHTIDRLAWQEP